MKYWLIIFGCILTTYGYTQNSPSQLGTVDFKVIKATVEPNMETKGISGKLQVFFIVEQDVDKVFLDAKGMTITKPDPEITTTATATQIILENDFKVGEQYSVDFEYTTIPKQTLYFVNDGINAQIWTQGQGKYTSYWLPSIDDTNDKIEFDLSIIAPKNHQVIANGKLTDNKQIGEKTIWNYEMSNPMSSYLVAFASGQFAVKEDQSASGVPLLFYYNPKDEDKVEATYRYSAQIFDFLEETIGIPYPWQNYKQIPVKDFLYAGMENTGTTIFSDSFVVDDIGFFDRNYVNVNAHELAHQWFGDLVTASESEHHWLQEGFATYYALLAERDIFGEDYFYYRLYESAEQLKQLSDTGKGQKLVNAKASSLTYYQKGAWALHILKERVGEIAFAKAVKAYLHEHQYGNVTTDDFMTAVELASGKDLTQFKKDWLQQSAFQDSQALESLKKSDFMKRYFELVALRKAPLNAKSKQLQRVLVDGNDYLGQEAVYQISGEPIAQALPLYFEAFDSQNTFIRQAVALSLNTVPEQLIPLFTTLLDDQSYVTQEQALLKLWLFYSEQSGDTAIRAQYEVLDKMDPVFGFSDGNIRTLWLALALASSGYEEDQKLDHYNELKSYTAPSQAFQLRQNAFQYLYQIQLFDKESLKNLIEACVHHNWRFRESSRDLLTVILKNQSWSAQVDELMENASAREKAYLQRIKAEK